jgi:hypothetical protein
MTNNFINFINEMSNILFPNCRRCIKAEKDKFIEQMNLYNKVTKIKF